MCFPDDVRIDGWVDTGTEVSSHYDSLLAKLIVWGETREAAISKLIHALGSTRLFGIPTNVEYLLQIVSSAAFRNAKLSTHFLDSFVFVAPVIEVLEAGTYTTVQDYPGNDRINFILTNHCQNLASGKKEGVWSQNENENENEKTNKMILSQALITDINLCLMIAEV